jgi:hypothetical protein
MKAFPLKAVNLFDDNEGMDLRDYFAAKAMQAILSDGLDPIDTARFAYAYADAMMKAREK